MTADRYLRDCMAFAPPAVPSKRTSPSPPSARSAGAADEYRRQAREVAVPPGGDGGGALSSVAEGRARGQARGRSRQRRGGRPPWDGASPTRPSSAPRLSAATARERRGHGARTIQIRLADGRLVTGELQNARPRSADATAGRLVYAETIGRPAGAAQASAGTHAPSAGGAVTTAAGAPLKGPMSRLEAESHYLAQRAMHREKLAQGYLDWEAAGGPPQWRPSGKASNSSFSRAP